MFIVTYEAALRGSIIALWHRPSVFEKKKNNRTFMSQQELARLTARTRS